jgi:transketolase
MANLTLTPNQRRLRKRLLELYYNAKCGHIGCSLSCIDILFAVFTHKMESESFVLSKGHAAGGLYLVLDELGRLPDSAPLTSFYRDGTKLAAHPVANLCSDVRFGLGSLGHGLPLASGIAYGKKFGGSLDRTFVLLSDGETNEGTTWEGAHFSVRHSLSNLIVIIDRNGLQGFGKTEDVLGDTANPELWKAIGFDVYHADGHNGLALSTFIDHTSKLPSSKPRVLIADTVKGSGVDFMENKLEWHYLPMTDDMYHDALRALAEDAHEE